MVEFEDELEEEFDEEFDDEFEEDWEEFEPEPEEFFTGPLYIPTESSVNFELYSLFGSIVVMLIASFMLYTKVLVGVYDGGFGSGTMEDKIANFDYQLAQDKVEIVGFGQYNNEDKSGAYDYAVLDAGSKQGLVPGMIFYFQPANGSGPRNGYWTKDADYLAGAPNAKDLTMLVVKKVYEKSAWAIFAKYLTEEDKAAFKSATGKEFKNILNDERLALPNEPSYIEYTDKDNPVSLDTPFPYSPKPLKPFQYFIWEEAFDVSGEKTYKPISMESIDKEFKSIENTSNNDYTDTNLEWNMMKRVTLSLDDIKKLLEISGTDYINKETSKLTDDSKGNFENAIVIFNDSQYVFLAPPVDQSLFNVVYKLLEKN